MKSKIAVVALVFALFFSCEKKETAKSGSEGKATQAANAQTEIIANNMKNGYVLRVNAAFYTLENDTGSESDKTRWAASMSLGEKVLVGKERKAIFSGDGKIYTFVEICRDDGKEGLAWASQVAEGTSLGVVVDKKTNLHTSPKTIDVTGNILSYKTIVVLLGGENDGFIEIRAYDPVAEAYRQNYIRTATISRKNSDIQSSILMQTAQPLKDDGAEKIRKDALLESALLDYPDSVFSAEIQSLVNPNSAAVINTEPVSISLMTVNDNDVNVRELPDPVAGRVIGTLQKNTNVTVSEQTVSQFTVSGFSAHWYYITAPLEGWVFGIYLE